MSMGKDTIISSPAETQTTPELRIHPLYWFDDGSLILEVQDVQFRVHRSLLQRHSAFLVSAESITSKFAHTPTANGAHHVPSYVSCGADCGFNSRDVEALLEHMYHDFPLSSNSTFERIVAVLRSSSPQQFDMPALHAHAKECLVTLFDAMDPSEIKPDNIFEAVTIGRTFRFLPALKNALYQAMLALNFDSDDEVPNSDPALLDPQTQTLSRSAVTSDSPPAGEGYQLTKLDVRLCKSLMTRVIDHFTPVLFTPATTPHMACTDVFADTWMSLVISPAIENDGVYKPIETLERIKALDWAKYGLCTACVEEKREEWTEEQETVWNMIEKWLEEENEI